MGISSEYTIPNISSQSPSERERGKNRSLIYRYKYTTEEIEKMNMLETYNLNSTNYYAHLTEASYDLAAAAAAAAAKPDVNVVHPSPDSHQVLTGAHTVGNTSPSLIPK